MSPIHTLTSQSQPESQGRASKPYPLEPGERGITAGTCGPAASSSDSDALTPPLSIESPNGDLGQGEGSIWRAHSGSAGRRAGAGKRAGGHRAGAGKHANDSRGADQHGTRETAATSGGSPQL